MPIKYLYYLLLTFGTLISPFAKARGQEKDIPKELYVAANIPDSLEENANSVVRYAETKVRVTGPGHRTIRFHGIVTILNDKGDSHGVLQLFYNKRYNTFSSIQMVVYDANGTLIKKYNKSDMYDGTAIEDVRMVIDERFLAVKHDITSYPVTIESEYEENVSSSLDLGRWYIQNDQQAIQSATYGVSIGCNAGFRYLNKNISISPVKEQVDSTCNYTWVIKGRKAIKLEEHAEPWRVFPSICFAMDKFEFYGMEGYFNSWKNFGNWVDTLNVAGALLSPERDAEIRAMTDTIKTDKAKAKFLYNYLQRNMRYFNISLGVGSLKPLDATFVDQKKYGDCKGLSNYMNALLNAVGIKSYYAFVNCFANQEPADPSFPFFNFNHAILCVPFKTDTAWLECTNSTNQFGKLGTFTENRRALLMTEDGGKLVNTPRSTMDDNLFNSEVHLTLDADGGAKADVKIRATGVYRDDIIGISSVQIDRQKEILMHLMNIQQPYAFDVNHGDDKDGERKLGLHLEYDTFGDMAGDKLFCRPNVMDLVALTVPLNDHRKSDYYFDVPMQKSCVTTIDLPPDFEVEALPINQSQRFTYGNYDLKYTYDAAKNQVTGTAKFNLTNHVIPAAKYTEMQQYLDAVAKAQNKKLVIKRKA